MIHLGIDSRDLFGRQVRGVGRTLDELLNHMVPLLPGWKISLYTNRIGMANVPTGARVKKIDMPGDRFDAWERVRFPVAALTDRVNLLHCPSQTAPPLVPCPLVLTVHDLIPLKVDDGWSESDTSRFRRAVRRSIGSARRIIAISDFTKADILTHFSVPEDKIDVIHWGISREGIGQRDDNLIDQLLRLHGIQRPFFVAFGGESPRKNVPRILAALDHFARHTTSAIQLVLLGTTESGAKLFRSIVEQLDLSNRVIFLGYLEQRNVASILGEALALVYPSLYEGFGLPILEAMVVGTPVVTSNRTSMPEIAGDAALLVDPLSPGAIAEAMRECFASPRLVRDLRAKGLRRLQSFSWERAAQQTVAVYRKALSA